MDKLKDYELNLKCSLEKLKQYGFINGAGYYSVEYAKGNYIYFSTNSGIFIGIGSWCSFAGIEYENLLEEKIKVLKNAKIIRKKNQIKTKL